MRLSIFMATEYDVMHLSIILGKTHTLMAPDGITAGVIERCFKRITQDDHHDYKVHAVDLITTTRENSRLFMRTVLE